MNNSKNSILLVDPEFDPNTAADCNLLLKITADSFSYAVIDKNSRQLKAVFDQQECDDTAAELASALKKDSYLQLPFREIKVSVYTPNTIAVPNGIFNGSELESYANFFADATSTQVNTSLFAQFGFTSVFKLEQFTEETLNTSLASAARYEHHAPLLALASDAEGTALLLDFTAGSFNALLLQNHKVIFQNSFQIDTPDEFNYYLLLLIQELKLAPACSTVLLSGIIHQDDSYYNCLCKYFDNIRFNLPPAVDIDHAILDDMPAHYYSSLLALDLCV
ncbi:DUF3822 family protein [Pedobacter hartonius]|uniref:DUF3822 domain-containing protein n=1 Tax=Pedobacter hartonius TaxID=425514 RepID=A0A1H3WX80_9SPHI|nr:DUF3822 family protein [Pedobacter hartonius]SDZ90932.1 Protein of unknown function [Pedobacter hartonius]